MVDSFLRDQNLGTRDIAAMLAPSPISPPPQLRDKGRAGFSDYLSASPHRAFAVSPKGAFAFRSGRRSTREAAEGRPHRLRRVRARLHAICGRRSSRGDRQRRIALNVF